jgi:hypothetical protein
MARRPPNACGLTRGNGHTRHELIECHGAVCKPHENGQIDHLHSKQLQNYLPIHAGSYVRIVEGYLTVFSGVGGKVTDTEQQLATTTPASREQRVQVCLVTEPNTFGLCEILHGAETVLICCSGSSVFIKRVRLPSADNKSRHPRRGAFYQFQLLQ